MILKHVTFEIGYSGEYLSVQRANQASIKIRVGNPHGNLLLTHFVFDQKSFITTSITIATFEVMLSFPRSYEYSCTDLARELLTGILSLPNPFFLIPSAFCSFYSMSSSLFSTFNKAELGLESSSSFSAFNNSYFKFSFQDYSDETPIIF